MPPRITQKSYRLRVSDRTMVGTLPSGCCLQGVRAEPQIRTKPVTTCEFLQAWGNLSKGRRTVGRSEPEPASAHSLSMSFPLAIPGRVALQQSLPPLRQPPPLCRNRIPTVQSPRLAHVVASPHRAGCREHLALSGQGRVFLLDIPSYRTRPSMYSHCFIGGHSLFASCC